MSTETKTIAVYIEYTDGNGEEMVTPDRAKHFVENELRWENTVRVQCPELGIDERGDYHGQTA
jgi:hypothetical protein